MSPSVRRRALAALRWAGTIIGLMLIVLECFDAMVTPRPDWIWFTAAALLIGFCWPLGRQTEEG